MERAEYAFDPAAERERERLAGLERALDPGTMRRIAGLGDAGGWRCLEAGAGGGTIASWLCEHVGPAGHVVATDPDTRFLEELDHPNLEVRRHDVVADPLEPRSFDLVHARALLEHLPARDDVVARLVEALKPGGWLLVEDFDLTPVLSGPADAWFVTPEDNRELLLEVFRAMRDAFADVGGDLDYGNRLPGVLMAHGLAEVGAELESGLVRGGSDATVFSRLSIELLRPLLADRLGEDRLDEAIRRHDDPGTAWMSIPLVAAWGRRPPGPRGSG